MSTRLTTTRSVTLFTASILALAGAAVVNGQSTSPAPAPATGPQSKPLMRTQDMLVMKSGTVVKGQILEEAGDSVSIMVEFANMPPVKTSYPKSDILEIKRKVPADGPAPAASKDAATSSTDTSSSDAADSGKGKDKDKDKEKLPSRLKEQQAPTAVDDATAAKLMILNIKGELGWDTTEGVFKDVFKAVDAEFNDLDSQGNVRQEFRENGVTPHVVVLKMDTHTDPRRGFDGFFAAEKFDHVMEEQINKGRDLVVWIKEVDGGAGYFPLMFKNIYWTNDGYIRGTGDLDTFDIGDHMVNEKQISLRLGHVRGMAVEGGYGEVGTAIVDALSRGQNWLAVRMEGGKPIVIEHQPKPEDGDYNWTILKDDGKGANKDATVLHGNDHLELDEKWAHNLGISKGTVDSDDDMAFALQINRNYKVITKSKAEKVLEKWSEDIKDAWDLVKPGSKQERPGRLRRELADIKVEGTYQQRVAARGHMINIYNQMISLFNIYGEAWDEDGSVRAQIRMKIREIQEAADKDRRANSASSGGGMSDNGG